ncbi:hypothetical protein SY2F82_00600 [Streptomyces sp. Y2F8-2]|nr:hypothetical protein SY2F82_00600 [Streptomyces sp. Y2F8-2]
MDGMATFTMVPSSRSIRAATIITAAAAQRRGYDSATGAEVAARVELMVTPGDNGRWHGPDLFRST